jgi:hypothetical protein
MLRGKQYDQDRAAAAIAARAALDAFAVLPQDPETVISISAEPRGWNHRPTSTIWLATAAGLEWSCVRRDRPDRA